VINRAVFAAVVSLMLAGGVRAQDSADDAKKALALEEARQHVARAKVHYDLGEFKEAADEYITVYRLRPLPAILFNVAQAYRQGGLYEKAKQFYKSYLRESPDAKNRVAIEQSIRELDELLAKERRTKEKPPRGVKEPVEPAQAANAPAQKTPEAAKEPHQTAPPTGAVAQTTQPGAPASPVAPASSRSPASSAAPGAALPPAVSVKMPAPVSQKYVSSTQRTLSFVLGGVSVALLGGGFASAMKAKSYNNELLAGPHSAATTNDLMATSSSAGKLSTILFVTGLATAAGAGVLYFVPFTSGAGVGGSF